MKPIHTKVDGDKLTYVYDPIELSRWLEEGKKNGDVGYLAVSRNIGTPKSTDYWVFGTIENPCPIMTYWTLIDSPFDNTSILGDNPSFESFTFEILDLGKIDKI